MDLSPCNLVIIVLAIVKIVQGKADYDFCYCMYKNDYSHNAIG